MPCNNTEAKNTALAETDRLLLLPLTSAQLRLWLEDIPQLEDMLNCSYQGEPVEGVFRDIIAKQAEKVEQDCANAIFHTFLLIIRKEDRVVVGSADYKNIPNDKQEVEIGYGLGEVFTHQGYMTETVQAMCDWALKQAGISNIIAETDADNIPSQNVLIRCGFTLYKKENTWWWRL